MCFTTICEYEQRVSLAKTLQKAIHADKFVVNICMTTPTITLADVASMISIIEASSTRGAFRANELTSVGELYNRLQAFLEYARSQLEKSQGEANAETHR